jgi:hypothetical protein
MKRFLAYSFLCVFIFSSNACSVKIAYHFLDNLLGWQLGTYVSLDSKQKRLASSVFKDFHSWHRRTQLPSYSQYFTHTKALMAQGNITAEQLHAESDKLQDLLDVSVDYLMPGVVEIIGTFNEDQVAEILKNLKEKGDDFYDKRVDTSAKKIQKLRIKDFNQHLEGFFGSYSDEQELEIKLWAKNLQPYEALMLKQKRTWEQDIAKALTKRNNPKELTRELKSLVMYRTDEWDADLQKVLDENQVKSYGLLANLANSRSERQKTKSNEKFDRYIKIFDDMTSHQPASEPSN